MGKWNEVVNETMTYILYDICIYINILSHIAVRTLEIGVLSAALYSLV
mgnify:CR=1 FL=1